MEQRRPPPRGRHPLRVFVLSTGRCGSLTFARALEHVANYSVGHETRAGVVVDRLDYPDQHIEVDNRLSWFLGALGHRYPAATYVHLARDPQQVAESYAARFGVRGGIMPAFASGILFRATAAAQAERLQIAKLYVNTVTTNIAAFVNTLPPQQVIHVNIENPHASFDRLWDLIDAFGYRSRAHAELDRRHNMRRSR